MYWGARGLGERINRRRERREGGSAIVWTVEELKLWTSENAGAKALLMRRTIAAKPTIGRKKWPRSHW